MEGRGRVDGWTEERREKRRRRCVEKSGGWR
jgi:hypothetical protein